MFYTQLQLKIILGILEDLLILLRADRHGHDTIAILRSLLGSITGGMVTLIAVEKRLSDATFLIFRKDPLKGQ